MLSVFKRIVSIIVCLYCFSSCYDDLGNYDYNEIDDISVSLPDVVSVLLPVAGATPCEIIPEITQTSGKGESGLKYRWRRQIIKNYIESWVDVNNKRDLKLWVYSNETQREVMRFEVTDTVTGLTAGAIVQIWKKPPFFASWFVLQEIDGQAQLGCVDLSGDEVVATTDIRKETLGDKFNLPQEKIEGAPRFIVGYPNYGETSRNCSSVIEVFTDQGGYMIDGAKLNVMYNYSQLLFLPQNPPMTIDPQFASADCGEIIINDGQLWFADGDGTSVYYPIALHENAGSSYYATHAIATSTRGGAFLYDQANRRFLFYHFKDPGTRKSLNLQIRGGATSLYTPSYQQKLTTLKGAYGYPDQFDPNKVDASRMLYMGTASLRRGGNSLCAVSVGTDDEGNCCIYELTYNGILQQNMAVCSGYWKYKPATRTDKWSVATSTAYERVFFYTAGNKVFRVNFGGTNPKEYVVYTHPDPGVELSHMKFQNERTCTIKDIMDGESTMNTQTTEMGMSVRYPDGREGILLLKLKSNGMLESEEDAGKGGKPVREYLGFKNIKDIAYTFQFPF